MTLAELWSYVHQVERDLQVDPAKVDSMEVVEPHEHRCSECQQPWFHHETPCYAALNGDIELPCPKCKDAYLLDLYAGDPPDTPDILDEDVALEMLEEPDPEWGEE